MGRLRALLHAQPEYATCNATAQQAKLHVASLRECNTQHRPAEEVATARKVFHFAPPSDPESGREALEERAAIIAEGCGMNPVQALQEARWQVERERAWRVFLRNAQRILDDPGAARAGLLDRYEAEARARYGKAIAKSMSRTMRGWVAARVWAKRCDVVPVGPLEAAGKP